MQLCNLYLYRKFMNVNVTPKKAKQQNMSMSSAIKISPVKVPVGAKQINNYILGKTIGTGTFGKVHLGLHIPTGQRVAVKIIEKTKLTNKDLERIHRQIEILKKIMHPYLIQLYQIIETQKSLLFITEYMQNGQLFNYIIQRKKLSQEEACRIFRQIIQGVQYMHKIGVAHRDLKPENIMIDYDGKIKIIDFGLSNIYKKNQKLKTECGSPCYAAPQMIQGRHKYDPLKIDIWSVGIVLFAMIAGYLPFCDPDTSKLYKKILIGNYKFPNGISDDVKDLIQKILITNPSKRATLQQIKQHPWYQREQSKKSIGIDTRFYKVPVEMYIINNIEKLGIKIPNLAYSIQQNLKNKQTAFYYILAKKMVKQGQIFQNYYGCSAFRQDNLQPLRIEDQSQNIESSTFIQVQQVEAIKPQQRLQSPQTNSSIQLQYLKSDNIDVALQQLMASKSQIQDKSKNQKKSQFYANSQQIKLKKHNLKLQVKKQQIKKQKVKKQEINQKSKIQTTIQIYTMNRNVERIINAYKRRQSFSSVHRSPKQHQLPQITNNKTKKSLQTMNTQETNVDRTQKKQLLIKQLSTCKNKQKRVPYILF